MVRVDSKKRVIPSEARSGVRQLAAAFPERELARAFFGTGGQSRPASWPEQKRQQAAALQGAGGAVWRLKSDDETLRQEVRFLTTRLGAIVQEQCGAKTFQAIERLRSLAKQIRKNPDPKLLEAKESAVRELSSRQATEVAHAFSLFFHLVNLCEERERVRRLSAYASQEAGAPMSLRRTFSELRRQEIPVIQLKRLLRSMHIEPVLTAHPTEAKRRSVLNHILRIGRTLEVFAGRPACRCGAGDRPLHRGFVAHRRGP